MDYCSFCGCSEDERQIMIQGPDNELFICDQCINMCNVVLKNVKPKLMLEKSRQHTNIIPKEIVEKLDEFVIGQDKAKKLLAVSVYNHYKKIKLIKNHMYVTKSNLLLIGPTGVGKTFLIEQIANLLDVPFIIVDTAQFTPKGYRGGDVNDIWVRLFNKCGGDENAVQKMKNAIVYFDEIDKLSPHATGTNDSRDFYSNVQNELLKVLESSELTFTIDSQMRREEITVDSTNMLFIFGGAFSGIEDIIQKRLGLSTKTSIGFGGNDNIISKDNKTNLISQVNLDDIREFGLTPEFIGRISSVVALDPLTVDDLVNILEKPKNNLIEQYQNLLKMDGIDLTFEPEAIREIAQKAYDKKTGARALKSIIEERMVDLMYELPSKKNINTCKITKDFIDGIGEAKLSKSRKRTKKVYNINYNEA